MKKVYHNSGNIIHSTGVIHSEHFKLPAIKRFLLLLTLIMAGTHLSGFSQVPGGNIKGSVRGNNQKSIESATVSLLFAKDSSLVKMTATDQQGNFSFDKITDGRYIVSASAVGHEKQFSETVELDAAHPSVIINAISLETVSKDLSVVTITAKKQMIEQKTDRMVVNVDAAVTNAGATALEVLEKSPGITVDKDGNVSLKGKQGVIIMLDGKPTYLSGTELVNLLRNMNANQLEQIEIMTNPPAKYDAAGNSGIINIKTRRNRQKGFNGSISAGFGQGSYWKTNNSLNLNYRNGKINSFLNLGYNKNISYEMLDIRRTYRAADGKQVSAIFEQSSFMRSTRDNRNLKAGMDYYIDQKTTVGVVFTGFISPEKYDASNTSYLQNGQRLLDSVVRSTNLTTERFKNGTLNLNFRRQFDSSGRELTADLDYVRYTKNSDQYFVNASFEPRGTKKNQTELKGLLPIGIHIYSAKADYTQRLRHGIRMEAGWKSSFVKTDNTANYYNLASAQWTPDYSKTNSFEYTENIHAAYVNFNKQVKKLGIQAGLRYENTSYKGVQQGNPLKSDSSFKRTYNSLFPTVYLSYAANDKNQFGLNVGRRIDRPAYQDLNPFLFFLDNYTYLSGNPYLKPQFSNNIELSHTYRNFLTTTLNYGHTKNYFLQTFEQSGYATIVRSGNIGVRNNMGISVSAQMPVQKWWTAIVYGNYNFNKLSGELYGEKLKMDGGIFLMNVNNQFRFNNGWGAELSGFYRSKGLDGQVMIMPLGQVSAGISKQVLQNKGSVRLNIRDIFYNNKAEGNINFQRTEAYFQNRRDSRVANITFTYRFGKPLKEVKQQRKTGGSTEEQNRIKRSEG